MADLTATNVTVSGTPIAALAWVDFTGTTGAVRRSYNISSVTRVSTGLYTLAFPALPTSTYKITVWARHTDTPVSTARGISAHSGLTKSTTSLQVTSHALSSGNRNDCLEGCVVLFQ